MTETTDKPVRYEITKTTGPNVTIDADSHLAGPEMTEFYLGTRHVFTLRSEWILSIEPIYADTETTRSSDYV